MPKRVSTVQTINVHPLPMRLQNYPVSTKLQLRSYICSCRISCHFPCIITFFDEEEQNIHRFQNNNLIILLLTHFLNVTMKVG